MQQQTQASTSQAPLMMEPPQIITTKDHLYLKDMLSWQLNAMKKCAHFANECTDTDVKQALNNAGHMHLRHYQMLLKHCQTDNLQALSQIPQPAQQQ